MFPRCSFAIELAESVLTAGTTQKVWVVVTADQAIPRAERVTISAQSLAQATLGSGRSRVVAREQLWLSSFDFPLPPEGLGAGSHRFECTLSIPASLGPAFVGEECAREHELWARLEVDWAVDPTAKFPLPIAAAPQQAAARPVLHRSAADFARDFLVDLSLESDVLVWGQTVRGEVAVRAAPDKKLKKLLLRLVSRDTVHLGGGQEERRTFRQEVSVPMVDLANERRVRFSIPIDERCACTHRDGYLDNDLELSYQLDLSTLAATPEASVALTVLPPGSTLTGASTLQPLHERRAIDEAAGLVRVQIADAPREGRLGAMVTLDFPDVALGIKLRELGLLDGFTSSPLLPADLTHRFHLRTHSELEQTHQLEFFTAALRELGVSNQIELTDVSLRYHLTLPNDAHFEIVHGQARERAKRMIEALLAFPFAERCRTREEAWRTVAAQPGALLLPHRPAIVGLSHALRTQHGEPRVFPFSLVTDADELVLLLDLEELGGSFSAREGLAVSPLLASLREHVTLFWMTPWRIGARAPQDRFGPKQAVAAVEVLAAWVMHARGEAVVSSPYR